MSEPTRRFSHADQEWFARVTGDFNPLHMDTAFASRTFPGEQVVHGISALLWALEQRCRADPAIRISNVQASFTKPILLGDGLTLGGDERRIWLLVRGELMATVILNGSVPNTLSPGGGELTWRCGSPPLDHGGEDLAGTGGEIEIPATAKELSAAFPCLTQAVGPDFVIGLASLSTLIGMVCPGRYSMLSELAVRTVKPGCETLTFEVLRHDRRFGQAQIAVRAPGLTGAVTAFAGEAEPSPADDAAIRLLLPEKIFSGQSPLVIGATGGIGAAVARILAAGGARPVLGYRDRALAEITARSVRRLGGCELVPFEATAPEEGLKALAALDWQGNEVYYFASPRIFRRRIEPYQAQDLRDFLNVFVDSFYETVRGLLQLRAGDILTIFYPSSVALDAPTADLFEYRTAKLAGEDLCKLLNGKYRRLRIISARLPRIRTRQTSTYVNARAENAEDAMIGFVREVQASTRKAKSPQ